MGAATYFFSGRLHIGRAMWCSEIKVSKATEVVERQAILAAKKLTQRVSAKRLALKPLHQTVWVPKSNSKSKIYSETVNNHNSSKITCATNTIPHIQTESKAYKCIQRYMLGENRHTSVSQKLI